jgi:hypothetical protein
MSRVPFSEGTNKICEEVVGLAEIPLCMCMYMCLLISFSFRDGLTLTVAMLPPFLRSVEGELGVIHPSCRVLEGRYDGENDLVMI